MNGQDTNPQVTANHQRIQNYLTIISQSKLQPEEGTWEEVFSSLFPAASPAKEKEETKKDD
jgi:hypothetical protein